MHSLSIVILFLISLLLNCSLYFPDKQNSLKLKEINDSSNEVFPFTLVYPTLQETQLGSLREFLHKNLHSHMNENIQKWNKENIHFDYIPVWSDIPGVDNGFSYNQWTKKNIIEVKLRHSYTVGTLNSFLHIFSLGIIPGFQDTTWYADINIYDTQGKLHNLIADAIRVSEITSSLFFPIWLTGIKSDYKPILREVLKNSLLEGRAYIEKKQIPILTMKELRPNNSIPDFNSPISIKNTILECNIHLQERGTPNVISYHPPVGQGGLCRWSVVFYNHTEEEISLDAKDFQLVLTNKKRLSPFSEIFVRASYYNQGASTSNNGLRKLNSHIKIPSYKKEKEDATLGIAYPFTNYTFYFPYKEKEDILSLESDFEGKKIGILYQE